MRRNLIIIAAGVLLGITLWAGVMVGQRIKQIFFDFKKVDRTQLEYLDGEDGSIEKNTPEVKGVDSQSIETNQPPYVNTKSTDESSNVNNNQYPPGYNYECPAGQYPIGDGTCKAEPTGCPYGDSIPMDECEKYAE